jgi:hypothetical protein
VVAVVEINTMAPAGQQVLTVFQAAAVVVARPADLILFQQASEAALHKVIVVAVLGMEIQAELAADPLLVKLAVEVAALVVLVKFH